MRVIFMLALLGLIAGFAALAFGAEPVCDERRNLARTLTMLYGQVQAGQVVSGDGLRMAELFVNPKSGAWTLLASTPDGMACIGPQGTGAHALFAAHEPGEPL